MSIRHYYIKRRRSGTVAAFRVTHDQQLHGIDPRLDLRRHSPTGFEFGYGGSGPAQLALAILADYANETGYGLPHLAGDEVALNTYQSFKREFIARLPSGHLDPPVVVSYEIPAGKIKRWLDRALEHPAMT